jgi:hypothetical protein
MTLNWGTKILIPYLGKCCVSPIVKKREQSHCEIKGSADKNFVWLSNLKGFKHRKPKFCISNNIFCYFAVHWTLPPRAVASLPSPHLLHNLADFIYI